MMTSRQWQGSQQHPGNLLPPALASSPEKPSPIWLLQLLRLAVTRKLLHSSATGGAYASCSHEAPASCSPFATKLVDDSRCLHAVELLSLVYMAYDLTTACLLLALAAGHDFADV